MIQVPQSTIHNPQHSHFHSFTLSSSITFTYSYIPFHKLQIYDTKNVAFELSEEQQQQQHEDAE